MYLEDIGIYRWPAESMPENPMVSGAGWSRSEEWYEPDLIEDVEVHIRFNDKDLSDEATRAIDEAVAGPHLYLEGYVDENDVDTGECLISGVTTLEIYDNLIDVLIRYKVDFDEETD